jgi:ParB-like chromosome segregation protein Spo0J
MEAYKALGRDRIPCIVIDGDDQQAAVAEIMENLIRNEVRKPDRANETKRLVDMRSKSPQDRARRRRGAGPKARRPRRRRH